MPKFTAVDYFVDWYRNADPNISTETKQKRLASIEKYIKEKSNWPELLKITIGENPATDALEAFVATFRDNDDTFPLINNDNLIRTLAKIAICIKLEGDDDRDRDIIAYSILNYSFNSPKILKDDIPMHAFAQDYINRNFSKSRTLIEKVYDPQKFNEAEKLIEESTADDLVANLSPFFAVVKGIVSRIDAINEEVNVLWWLFGEHLETTKKSFKESGPITVAIMGALELTQLTEYGIALPSAKALLQKAVNISIDKETKKTYNFPEILANIPAVIKPDILRNYKTQYAMFIPVLSLIYDALQESSPDINLLLGKYNISPETEFDLSTISYQLYNEYFLLNSL